MLSFFIILTSYLALPTPAQGPWVQRSIELLRRSPPALAVHPNGNGPAFIVEIGAASIRP